MNEARLPDEPVQRVPSGIHGLDTVLNGGWLHGGTYIILGSPGTGKTILGNQFCFSSVSAGGRAVYITVLAESHGRMMKHLQSMHFFRREEVGRRLHYISGYATLKAEGLAGLSRLVFHAVREHQATALVLDGLSSVEERAESQLVYHEFLHGLCVHNALTGCTTLLVNLHRNMDSPQLAMLDGVVLLRSELIGLQMVRSLEVVKFRGGAQLAGKHTFDITDDGLRIYPRTEALYSRQPPVEPDPRHRQHFGIPQLDAMLGGGVVAWSSTLIFGVTGSGKTLLGMHYLAEGARRGEPSLYYGFTETPPRLVLKAASVGLELGPLLDSGRLRLEGRLTLEMMPDALVQDLLVLVERHRPQRLLIDGIEPFIQGGFIDRKRSSRLLSALANELRARQVTVMMTQQASTLLGPELNTPLDQAETIVDNFILLRFVEMRSQFYRMISVLKMRESDCDPAFHLFSMSSEGVHIAETFESAEAVLTGQARPLAPPSKGKKPQKRGLQRRRRRS